MLIYVVLNENGDVIGCWGSEPDGVMQAAAHQSASIVCVQLNSATVVSRNCVKFFAGETNEVLPAGIPR